MIRHAASMICVPTKNSNFQEASFSLAEAKFAAGGDFNQAVLQNVNKVLIEWETQLQGTEWKNYDNCSVRTLSGPNQSEDEKGQCGWSQPSQL